ncbi:MAG: MFS transporter [Bacteroidales bacterium]|nr:MFS transporter [Bacteroidales bacterium]
MNKSIKFRLIVMNLIQWAVWGAYLTSMGQYLGSVGLGPRISIFYAMQGIVSMFMPALMGIVADKYIPAQKLLGICHGIAGAAMTGAAAYCMTADAVSFGILFSLYSVSVAFYMPTIALSNSVAFKILADNGYDTVKDFPPIRVFGTVGFIVSMWFVNFMTNGDGISFQKTYDQFYVSGVLGLLMLVYCFTLPACPCKQTGGAEQTLAQRFGLDAFKLFKNRNMATFFTFSMLLGMALQITNSYATPFIEHFAGTPEFADTWGARNPVALYSISQVAETLGILLIPVAMRLFGIKKVMLIAMFAWVLRFGLFGAGDTGSGLWMLILSMIVYGVAFDFFNISGALYTNMRTSEKIQNSAQGLFMLMTNGIGATVGTLAAGAIMNHYVYNAATPDWSTPWYIFAGYALVVAILFIFMFKQPADPNEKVA